MTETQEGYDAATTAALRLGLITAGGSATDRCQCPTCCAVFSTETNFGRHLAPSRNDEDSEGPWCRTPAEVGLVQAPGGWWQQPGPPEAISRAGGSGAQPGPVPNPGAGPNAVPTRHGMREIA
jgi:hypothetical protein